MKICRDCALFEKDGTCAAPAAAWEPDFVHGTRGINHSCRWMREEGRACGPEGTLWAPVQLSRWQRFWRHSK